MQRLPQAGYAQYEISNYARPGFESKHNQSYWAGADYLGLGPSAVSTIDRVRTKNLPDTAGYMAALAKNESPRPRGRASDTRSMALRAPGAGIAHRARPLPQVAAGFRQWRWSNWKRRDF